MASGIFVREKVIMAVDEELQQQVVNRNCSPARHRAVIAFFLAKMLLAMQFFDLSSGISHLFGHV